MIHLYVITILVLVCSSQLYFYSLGTFFIREIYCILQLIDFYNNISKALNNNYSCDIDYIEMAKVFDKVCQVKLLFKV